MDSEDKSLYRRVITKRRKWFILLTLQATALTSTLYTILTGYSFSLFFGYSVSMDDPTISILLALLFCWTTTLYWRLFHQNEEGED